MKVYDLLWSFVNIGALLVALMGGGGCLLWAYLSSGRQRKILLGVAGAFASIPPLLFTAQYLYFHLPKGAATAPLSPRK